LYGNQFLTSIIISVLHSQQVMLICELKTQLFFQLVLVVHQSHQTKRKQANKVGRKMRNNTTKSKGQLFTSFGLMNPNNPTLILYFQTRNHYESNPKHLLDQSFARNNVEKPL